MSVAVLDTAERRGGAATAERVRDDGGTRADHECERTRVGIRTRCGGSPGEQHALPYRRFARVVRANQSDSKRLLGRVADESVNEPRELRWGLRRVDLLAQIRERSYVRAPLSGSM